MQAKLIFCKQFGLPLPGIISGISRCPGCQHILDVYGSHLLNCNRIGNKNAPDPFNKQILHERLGLTIAKLLSNKFYAVRTNPTGSLARPWIENGKTLGRLDLQYVKGDTGETILGDVSISNPLTSEAMLSNTQNRMNVLDLIRTKKNNTYRKAIQEQFPNTGFVVLPFSMYGQIGAEIISLLAEVAEHVHRRNPLVDKGILLRKYRRELACVVHQGVARLLATRLDCIRSQTNQFTYHIDDVRGIVNVLLEEANDDRQYVD